MDNKTETKEPKFQSHEELRLYFKDVDWAIVQGILFLSAEVERVAEDVADANECVDKLFNAIYDRDG